MYRTIEIRNAITKFMPDIRSLSVVSDLRHSSKKKRRRILRRDNNSCLACSGESKIEKLEIAHIIPVAEYGSSESDNLITLCRGNSLNPGCHDMYDNGYGMEQGMRRSCF